MSSYLTSSRSEYSWLMLQEFIKWRVLEEANLNETQKEEDKKVAFFCTVLSLIFPPHVRKRGRGIRLSVALHCMTKDWLHGRRP